MATRHISEKRYNTGLYMPAFTVCDAVELYWERGIFGVYELGILRAGNFLFRPVKAVTDDFGDLVQVH